MTSVKEHVGSSQRNAAAAIEKTKEYGTEKDNAGGETPQRLIEHTDDEGNYCFLVAREQPTPENSLRTHHLSAFQRLQVSGDYAIIEDADRGHGMDAVNQTAANDMTHNDSDISTSETRSHSTHSSTTSPVGEAQELSHYMALLKLRSFTDSSSSSSSHDSTNTTATGNLEHSTYPEVFEPSTHLIGEHRGEFEPQICKKEVCKSAKRAYKAGVECFEGLIQQKVRRCPCRGEFLWRFRGAQQQAMYEFGSVEHCEGYHVERIQYFDYYRERLASLVELYRGKLSREFDQRLPADH